MTVKGYQDKQDWIIDGFFFLTVESNMRIKAVMPAHSGYIQLFMRSRHIFVFFISETKLCAQSRVSCPGMNQFCTLSTVAVEEKAEGRRTKEGIRL